MVQLWAGVDAGKPHHHCVVMDADGTRLYSQPVADDESALLNLIADVVGLSGSPGGGEVVWATDLNHGGAALLIALLAAHDQRLLYIPGRTVHHTSKTYRGDGKTDAKDALVIADQARRRRNLQPLRVGDEASVDLRILTARRADRAIDRGKAINRLRAQLLEYFPALEQAFDYSRSKAALRLLTRYRAGEARVHAWLKKHGACSSALVAEKALTAAKSQYTVVPAQRVGEVMVAALAQDVLDLERELADLDALISARVLDHRHTSILLSTPGFGAVLSSEFLGATGGNMAAFDGADRRASVAGLAPVPKDSGRISGNDHPPRRYDRRLLRVVYLAAISSLKSCPPSRTYYDRKRAEGKSNTQAIICLARRRLNVLWAVLRDGTTYTSVSVFAPVRAA